jgi:hypothetical protein
MDIKKIIAKLPVGYAEDCAGYDGDRLRAEIIRAETNLRTVEQEMKADEKLTGARELIKDFMAPYNEAKKAQRAKIAYSLHVLEERGELGTGAHAADEAVE